MLELRKLNKNKNQNMTTKENLIYIDPNRKEAKIPYLNGQKPLNYGNNKHLEKKHNAEKEKLFINYEKETKEVRKETKEHLWIEKLIHKTKRFLYDGLGIDDNQNKNSPEENFAKGVIDEFIGNGDLILEIIKTDGKVLLDALKQLMSVEGMKALAKGLEESAVKLATGNAYEKGKSFVELGLVSTGAFAGFKIAKFGIKKLKHIDVPKHHFDKLSVSDIAKMSDSDKLDVARFFMKNHFKKEISKDQENAIIAAHKVGENREGAGVYNYNFSEKAEKLKILEKAGFTKGERKLLLEKGVCGKIPEAIDFTKTDTLEMKGTYELDKIKGLNIITASKKIEEFSKSIDVKYLVNHPARIDSMLDIVESMCDYIDKNHDLIMRLDRSRLEDFRMSFNEMRKSLGKVGNDKMLKEVYRSNILEIYDKNIIKSYYKLYPNLSTKK
ncbi:MAG: hypothetical protein PHG82_00535 [Candidatus Gracilibacteria bacterium]|nr:hypothetical protein [Candidatus Gracilibacteria bacterium]